MKKQFKNHKFKDWEYWYDRPSKTWWIAKFDSEGNQIGDAEHGATKELILMGK